jgi:glycosyltransferase involved in cell wall biosynthesis
MESTPKASAPTENWIALLGRRDTPVDGVEDYCTFLGKALARRGVSLKAARVDWANSGWVQALFRLRSDCTEWRGKWVLLQYTALGWSRRGFPIGALLAMMILKRGGARCAVVFHESSGLGGPRLIDRIRGATQDWIASGLCHRADRSIFTAPLHTITRLPRDKSKATFIPIGANIPERAERPLAATDRNGSAKTVVVFCLSDPPNRQNELDDISGAVRAAGKSGTNLRVVFVGRGTAEAKQEIETAFKRIPVELSNLGIRTSEEIGRILVESDVMLCVRGRLYPRRGSALAGIASGLPVIGYAGEAEGTPLAEAGVELVPYRDAEAMGRALARVLGDPDQRQSLLEKSRRAYSKYFSWGSIAAAFADFLEPGRAGH